MTPLTAEAPRRGGEANPGSHSVDTSPRPRRCVADRGDGHDGAVILADEELGPTPLPYVVLGLDCKTSRIRHANKDPLDCRREDLVVLTRSEHGIGAKKRRTYGGKPCTSQFKGVSLDRQGQWRVMIKRKDIKPRFLGRYVNELEAAQVYDQAVRQLFPEKANAWLNFPDGVDAWLEEQAKRSEQEQTREAA